MDVGGSVMNVFKNKQIKQKVSPISDTFTKEFLVGADLKSTLHRYIPASCFLMFSTRILAGDELSSK